MKTTARIRKSSRRRAFTLLEVLMVIIIIGVLAALVVPSLVGTGEGAKADITKAIIESGLATPLDTYKIHTGHYPTDEEGGLKALVERPSDENVAKNWRGPYVKDASKIKDAWGNELIYQAPGEYHTDSYDLSSPGPNGSPGDDDDITNWQKV